MAGERGRAGGVRLIAFLLYAFGLMEPITELTQNVTALQSGIAAAGRIRQVDSLEIETGDTERGGTERGATQGGAIAAVGGGDVDASVPDGSVPALELRDVTAAYGPDAEPAVRGINLRIPRRGHTEDELRQVLREVRLEDTLDALEEGLDTPLSAASLSGGQRQRIALARAVLRTPEVLLLDEATAQVDGLTEAAIHDCIRDCAATGAVVTIAHRLSTVVDADTTVVMEAGRIRAQGRHDELLATDGLYRDLVESLRIAGEPDRAADVPPGAAAPTGRRPPPVTSPGATGALTRLGACRARLPG